MWFDWDRAIQLSLKYHQFCALRWEDCELSNLFSCHKMQQNWLAPGRMDVGRWTLFDSVAFCGAWPPRLVFHLIFYVISLGHPHACVCGAPPNDGAHSFIFSNSCTCQNALGGQPLCVWVLEWVLHRRVLHRRLLHWPIALRLQFKRPAIWALRVFFYCLLPRVPP